jgi:hypothetical protein
MANGAQRIARQRPEWLDMQRRYPFSVANIVRGDSAVKHREWCQANCRGAWTVTWNEYRFTVQSDAVAFELVWG